MKGWLVGFVLLLVVTASGVGLWVTWDSTQTSPAATTPVGNTERLVTTTTSRLRATTTLPPAPACEVGDEPVATDPIADWDITVIDTGRALPATFVPPDLVDVTAAGFDTRDQVRAGVIPSLRALRAAAEANGTPIAVISGYRSFDYQQNLFARRVSEVGDAEASLRTARPGHSEHQLGTAVDVLDAGAAELTTAFAQTPAGIWVADHAHEFGFVPSYPDAARDRTCYEFEPWHLRFVGRENATAIHESGLTPREWMLARAAGAG